MQDKLRQTVDMVYFPPAALKFNPDLIQILCS